MQVRFGMTIASFSLCRFYAYTLRRTFHLVLLRYAAKTTADGIPNLNQSRLRLED
jgi:hypothetical protein